MEKGQGVLLASQIAETGYGMYQDVNAVNKVNTDQPDDIYNPRVAPPTFISMPIPEDITKNTGLRVGAKNALKGAATGASVGTAIGGPIGTAVGAAVGATAGIGTGIVAGVKASRKRDEFLSETERRKRDYNNALNNYFSIANNQSRNMAMQNAFNQRGNSYDPTASIYGVSDY